MKYITANIKTKDRNFYIIAEVKNGKKFNAIFNAMPKKSYKKKDEIVKNIKF